MPPSSRAAPLGSRRRSRLVPRTVVSRTVVSPTVVVPSVVVPSVEPYGFILNHLPLEELEEPDRAWSLLPDTALRLALAVAELARLPARRRYRGRSIGRQAATMPRQASV